METQLLCGGFMWGKYLDFKPDYFFSCLKSCSSMCLFLRIMFFALEELHKCGRVWRSSCSHFGRKLIENICKQENKARIFSWHSFAVLPYLNWLPFWLDLSSQLGCWSEQALNLVSGPGHRRGCRGRVYSAVAGLCAVIDVCWVSCIRKHNIYVLLKSVLQIVQFLWISVYNNNNKSCL